MVLGTVYYIHYRKEFQKMIHDLRDSGTFPPDGFIKI